MKKKSTLNIQATPRIGVKKKYSKKEIFINILNEFEERLMHVHSYKIQIKFK